MSLWRELVGVALVALLAVICAVLSVIAGDLVRRGVTRLLAVVVPLDREADAEQPPTDER